MSLDLHSYYAATNKQTIVVLRHMGKGRESVLLYEASMNQHQHEKAVTMYYSKKSKLFICDLHPKRVICICL